MAHKSRVFAPGGLKLLRARVTCPIAPRLASLADIRETRDLRAVYSNDSDSIASVTARLEGRERGLPVHVHSTPEQE